MTIKSVTVTLIERIRKTVPLIHNITNFVVMNSSANILLALGAAPVMAHCRQEVEEMASLADALVLNIGTLQEDWVESMIHAAKAASGKAIPIILDPVGAGATRFRTEAVDRIMAECPVSVLRGNASEIFSLGTSDIRTRGVDSTLALTDDIVSAAREMAREKGCIIAISGEEDCITDGARVFRVKNGQPIMTRVTGIGCGLSAITGAFCAVAGKNRLEATAAAFGFYGLCGDMAVLESEKPASFQVAFIDSLYAAGAAEIEAGLRVREV